ncbi:MAG: tetratricopeptide repeat protein [Chitinophagaceae bacterium]
MKKRLYLGFLLLFVILFLVAGCSNQRGESVNLLLKQPYSALSDSIKQYPADARFYLQRGLLLSQNNQHEIATADYKKAWEISVDAGAGLEYGSNLLLIGKTEEALIFLKDCQKKFSDNNEFGRRISEVYAQTGRRKEALAEYDKIIAQDSLNFLAYYERGLLLARLKDTAEALAALQKSYAIQPLNYTGLAIANIYSNQKDPRILTICDDMLKRDSLNAMVDPLLLKGIYYSDLKQYKPALLLFDECIKRDWKFIDAYIEKGIVWYEQKEFDKALETFKLGATVSNINADTYFWMGRCYEALNDKIQAKEQYERALTFNKYLTEAEEGIERLEAK